MQLIIKPTSKCNFNCSYCSAKNLKIEGTNKVDSKIRDYINEVSPSNIIITGGEPLCASPEWYKDLLTLGDFSISITSNLYNIEGWDFLLSNPRVKVTTSFQYSGGRIVNGWAYTSDQFEASMNRFYSRFNYVPPFISVLNPYNYIVWESNIKLAIKLGTKCRLNGVLPIGASKDILEPHILYSIWCDCIDKGYGNIELNCINRQKGICNLNTVYDCKNSIRCCWISNNKLITGFCEDILAGNVTVKGNIYERCKYCKAYKLCNGCHLKRSLSKPNCLKVLEVYERMKQLGFAI